MNLWEEDPSNLDDLPLVHPDRDGIQLAGAGMSPYLRVLAAHRSNAAQRLASLWGVPLWSLIGPSAFDGRYRQRQRNRVKRRNRR